MMLQYKIHTVKPCSWVFLESSQNPPPEYPHSHAGIPTIQFLITYRRRKAWSIFYQVYDELEAFSCSFCPRVSNICEARTYGSCSRQRMRVQNVFFQLGTTLPSVYWGRHWCHWRDKMDQAFPLHFCILQVIKNWTVGRPGNEAIF